MRGGFLRFQAQYLRRIRIPYWVEVPQKLRTKLIDAAKNLDLTACDQAACELYGLSREETEMLTTNI
jgi:PAS domain-containing protein